MISARFLIITFYCSISFFINAQTTNHQITDTLYQNLPEGGMFTIEQDLEVKNTLNKHQLVYCKPKTIVNKIVIERKDIANVPLADKCILAPKIMGFKIQISYTKDRASAEKSKIEFEKAFPSLTSEVKYLQPDFKLLVGDYLSRRSAAVYLNKIKRKYPGAFTIPFPVRCRVAQ